MAPKKEALAVGGTTSDLVTSVKDGTPFGPGDDKAKPASGDSKGLTIAFSCTATIKNCASLFGGGEHGGSKIGSGEGQEVIIELKGAVSANGGGATTFGGGEFGGSKIGSGEGDGKGAGQYSSSTAQSTAQSGYGDSKEQA